MGAKLQKNDFFKKLTSLECLGRLMMQTKTQIAPT